MFVLWKAAYDLRLSIWASTWDESWSGIGVMNIYTILILLELDLYVDGVLWSLMLIESTSKWGRGPLPLMTDCLCGQQTFKSGLACPLLIASFKLWACDDCSQLMNKNMAPHSSSFKEVVMWYVCTHVGF